LTTLATVDASWLDGRCYALAVHCTSDDRNNNQKNVYGAIFMTKVVARVHPVHLMNVDWVAANPQIKPIDLGCESAENCQLPSTSTIATVIITQPVS